jgi:hypothetical protein
MCSSTAEKTAISSSSTQHHHRPDRSRRQQGPYRQRRHAAAGACAGGQPGGMEPGGETLGRTHQPSQPHRPRAGRRSPRGPRRDCGRRHQPDRMGHTRPAHQPPRPPQNGQDPSPRHRCSAGHRLRRPGHRGRPPRSDRSGAHHRHELSSTSPGGTVGLLSVIGGAEGWTGGLNTVPVRIATSSASAERSSARLPSGQCLFLESLAAPHNVPRISSKASACRGWMELTCRRSRVATLRTPSRSPCGTPAGISIDLAKCPSEAGRRSGKPGRRPEGAFEGRMVAAPCVRLCPNRCNVNGAKKTLVQVCERRIHDDQWSSQSHCAGG